MNNIEIGQFLKKLRIEKNLTQASLAKELGVSHQAISKWEIGDNLPDLNALNQLSEFYGISIDNIIKCSYVKEDTISKNDNYLKKVILSISTLIFSYLLFVITFYFKGKNIENENIIAIIGISISLISLLSSLIIVIFANIDFKTSSKEKRKYKRKFINLYLLILLVPPIFILFVPFIFILVFIILLIYFIREYKNSKKEVKSIKFIKIIATMNVFINLLCARYTYSQFANITVGFIFIFILIMLIYFFIASLKTEKIIKKEIRFNILITFLILISFFLYLLL